jgi:hypothetical protein
LRVVEKQERLVAQHDDNADGDENGQKADDEQDGFDHPFADARFFAQVKSEWIDFVLIRESDWGVFIGKASQGFLKVFPIAAVEFHGLLKR